MVVAQCQVCWAHLAAWCTITTHWAIWALVGNGAALGGPHRRNECKEIQWFPFPVVFLCMLCRNVMFLATEREFRAPRGFRALGPTPLRNRLTVIFTFLLPFFPSTVLWGKVHTISRAVLRFMHGFELFLIFAMTTAYLVIFSSEPFAFQHTPRTCWPYPLSIVVAILALITEFLLFRARWNYKSPFPDLVAIASDIPPSEELVMASDENQLENGDMNPIVQGRE